MVRPERLVTKNLGIRERWILNKLGKGYITGSFTLPYCQAINDKYIIKRYISYTSYNKEELKDNKNNTSLTQEIDIPKPKKIKKENTILTENEIKIQKEKSKINFTEDKEKIQFDFENCFKEIMIILEKTKENIAYEEIQTEIEEFLYTQKLDYDESREDYLFNISLNIRTQLLELIPIWINNINDYRDEFNSYREKGKFKNISKLSGINLKRFVFSELLNNIDNNKIIGRLLFIYAIINKYQLTENHETHKPKTTTTGCCMRIAEEMVKLYINDLYSKQKDYNRLSHFIENMENTNYIFINLKDKSVLG